MTSTKIIDCTTCKYGYEDERLGIPMCHHPKRFSEDCVDSDFRMYEEKETKESEKPIDGLEEELDRFIASGKSVTVEDCGTYKVSYHDFKKVARHFAEWQKEQDLAEMAQSKSPLSVAYANRCFENGKQAMKEQMLKEAIDGTVYGNGEYTWVAGDIPSQFKYGDKVKLIICKEDGK